MSLLSFGDEAKEQEQEDSSATTKIKSYHDLVESAASGTADTEKATGKSIDKVASAVSSLLAFADDFMNFIM
jgi:hypothetical protein